MTHSIPCPAHGHLVTPRTACPACVGNQRAGGERQPGGWITTPGDQVRATLARAHEVSYALSGLGAVDALPPSRAIADLADALLDILALWERGGDELARLTRVSHTEYVAGYDAALGDLREVLWRHLGDRHPGD